MERRAAEGAVTRPATPPAIATVDPPSSEATGYLSPKGRRTRERLLAAARTVFERDGFLNARVADIASAAGVSHGTFYTYFDSKTKIFRSVMADVMALIWHTRTSTDGDPSLSPYEKIERSNRQFIRVYRENAVIMGLMEQAITYDEEVRQLRLMVRQRSVERVRLSVEQLQREGVVRTDLDAFGTASALVSMVSNCVYFWLVMGEGDYDDESMTRTLTELWASALELNRRSSTPILAPADT